MLDILILDTLRTCANIENSAIRVRRNEGEFYGPPIFLEAGSKNRPYVVHKDLRELLELENQGRLSIDVLQSRDEGNVNGISNRDDNT